MKKKKIRSTTTDEKEQKREHITECALSLFKQNHQFPSVDTVAKKAKIAKGTVYLYFSTKEEIFLSILASRFDTFFINLKNGLSAQMPTSKEMLANSLVAEFSKDPVLLELAAIGPSVLEVNVSEEKLRIFKTSLAMKLDHMANAISPLFAPMKIERIRKLLIVSFSLIIGIYLQVPRDGTLMKLSQEESFKDLFVHFEEDVLMSLLALWNGMGERP